MSKKKRKSKKTPKRSKITSEGSGQAKKQRDEKTTVPAVADIHADLRKTAILTAVCLAILFVLYLTQSRWF